MTDRSTAPAASMYPARLTKGLAIVLRWLCCAPGLAAACVDEGDGGATQSGASQGSEGGAGSSSEGAGTTGDDGSTTGSGETTGGGPTTGGGEDSVGDPEPALQPEVCAQMFRCLGEVAPEIAAPLLELYGEEGSCWELGADERAICAAACEGQLQLAYEAGLWEQEVCGGVFQPEPTGTKGPEDNDDACSDEFDNDGNGFVDCDDFSCSMNPYVTVCGGSTE